VRAGTRELPRPLAVIDAVASVTNVSAAELRGRSRNYGLTLPRHIAMYLVSELCGHSAVRTGELFGGRDHSSVLYGVKRVQVLIQTCPEVRAIVEQARRVACGPRGIFTPPWDGR